MYPVDVIGSASGCAGVGLGWGGVWGEGGIDGAHWSRVYIIKNMPDSTAMCSKWSNAYKSSFVIIENNFSYDFIHMKW